MVIASIEGNLVNLEATQQKLQADSLGAVTKQMVEEAKQVATHCTVEVAIIQVDLGGLCVKISAPTD